MQARVLGTLNSHVCQRQRQFLPIPHLHGLQTNVHVRAHNLRPGIGECRRDSRINVLARRITLCAIALQTDGREIGRVSSKSEATRSLAPATCRGARASLGYFPCEKSHSPLCATTTITRTISARPISHEALGRYREYASLFPVLLSFSGPTESSIISTIEKTDKNISRRTRCISLEREGIDRT